MMHYVMSKSPVQHSEGYKPGEENVQDLHLALEKMIASERNHILKR